MRNFPEADKIARRMQALLPDQIKAAEGEGQQQLPPQVQQALQSAAQQIQALQAQLQEAQSGIQSERMRAEMQLQIAQIKADAQRDVQELKGVVDLLKASIQPPQSLAANVSQDLMRQ
jgi:hypothetical protein